MHLIAFLLIIAFFSFQSCSEKEPAFDASLFELYDFPIHNDTSPDSLLKYYDELLEKRDNMPYAHLERGYIHLVNKDISKAESDFRQSINLKEEENDAYAYLATIYSLKGEPEKAFEQFKSSEKKITYKEEYIRLYTISLLYYENTEACKMYENYINNYEGEIPGKLSKFCDYKNSQ